jgi:glycine oxidase
MSGAEPRQRFAVIGGGIVGLCAARRLAQAGRETLLLERRRLGAGASGAAAGILSVPLDARSELQRRRLTARRGYPRFLADLEAETGLAIERQDCGMLFAALADNEAASLRAREPHARALGLAAAWEHREQAAARAPGLGEQVRGGLFVADAGRVHPPALLGALRASLERLRVPIREGLEGLRLERTSAGALRIAIAAGGGPAERLEGWVPVVCAGAWTSDLLAGVGVRLPAGIAPVRGQMLEIEAERQPPCMLDGGGVYLLPRPSGRLWIGATTEEVGFDEGITEAGAAWLLDRARALLPDLDPRRVVRAWSGLRPKALRRGGAILCAPEEAGAWVLAGHYKNGILLGPRDADELASRVLGIEAASFSPFFAAPG